MAFQAWGAERRPLNGGVMPHGQALSMAVGCPTLLIFPPDDCKPSMGDAVIACGQGPHINDPHDRCGRYGVEYWTYTAYSRVDGR